MTSAFRPVAPAQPAAAYIGGKKRLAVEIVRRIELMPHAVYAEPFVGMGGVFLRRRWAPPCEVVNDISRDVATLFRILQRHYPQFMETLKYQITSRAEFERLAAIDPTTLTDLERAARFLYLQRLAFGGKVAGRNFGVQLGPSRFRLNRGMSQTEVADGIGVTFQQVQKYEKGTNRIGAGRLFAIAGLLRVPISALFDGAAGDGEVQSPVALLSEPYALRLVQAFCALENAALRRTMFEFVEVIANTKADFPNAAAN